MTRSGRNMLAERKIYYKAWRRDAEDLWRYDRDQIMIVRGYTNYMKARFVLGFCSSHCESAPGSRGECTMLQLSPSHFLSQICLLDARGCR